MDFTLAPPPGAETAILVAAAVLGLLAVLIYSGIHSGRWPNRG